MFLDKSLKYWYLVLHAREGLRTVQQFYSSNIVRAKACISQFKMNRNSPTLCARARVPEHDKCIGCVVLQTIFFFFSHSNRTVGHTQKVQLRRAAGIRVHTQHNTGFVRGCLGYAGCEEFRLFIGYTLLHDDASPDGGFGVHQSGPYDIVLYNLRAVCVWYFKRRKKKKKLAYLRVSPAVQTTPSKYVTGCCAHGPTREHTRSNWTHARILLYYGRIINSGQPVTCLCGVHPYGGGGGGREKRFSCFCSTRAVHFNNAAACCILLRCRTINLDNRI